MTLLSKFLTGRPVWAVTFKGFDTSAWRAVLPSIQAVRIDNVAEYWARSSQEFWSIHDVPVVSPPFARMWLESRRPRWLTSAGAGTIDTSGRLPERWAAYVESRRDADGWEVRALCVMEVAEIQHPVVMGSASFRLDTTGRCLKDGMDGWAFRWAFPAWHQRQQEEIKEYVGGLLQPVWLALGFMNCRNVSRRDVPTNRAERRQADRAGVGGVRFCELEIGPMTRALDADGAAPAHGLGKALHICRGHFVTYDERPLFGKHRGTFWKPAHVRGAAERGVVVKDYRVLPPNEGAA